MEMLMDFELVTHVFETLRIAPPSKLTLLEAQTLSSAHVPPFPPDIPVLITSIDSQELALQVKKVLLAVYPEEHEMHLVEGQRANVEHLGNLQSSTFDLRPSTCLYLPSLGE